MPALKYHMSYQTIFQEFPEYSKIQGKLSKGF